MFSCFKKVHEHFKYTFNFGDTINSKKGFTLVEALIVTAITMIVVLSIAFTYSKTVLVMTLNKMKLDAVDIASEQIEIIRNLPYADVGIYGGIPSGKIDNEFIKVRGGAAYLVKTTIRNTDNSADGTLGGTPNDLSPADYKLVEVEVSCDIAKAAASTTASCAQFRPVSFTAIVAPKSLETASTNGALFVKVFDANGVVLPLADVTVNATVGTSTISISDTTDNYGLLQIIDAPPATNAYRISVTKSGFSTDMTYATSVSPYKPHATVLQQQVTQISFAIDQLATVNLQTLNSQCAVRGSVPLRIVGSKLITPTIAKASSTVTTNSLGLYTLSNVEWDTYSISPSGTTYDIWGTNPIGPVSVLPGSTQTISVITEPRNANTLLVGVKDSGTSLPIADATVAITRSGNTYTGQTGQGFVRQTDWSGGAGQTNYTVQNQFTSSTGVNYSSTPGQIRLQTGLSSGELTSSIIDMGTSTDFNQILWNPTDQPVQTGTTSVRMQVAVSDSNTATTTWNYVGPDGTSATYFTVTNKDINAAQTGRYIRYKAYLSTNNVSYTPNVADISITFTASCVPPGQVVFDGLTAGSYSYTISKTGYSTATGSFTVSSGWQTSSVSLSSL